MSANGVAPSPMLTNPTAPHKRSLKYARIRIVFHVAPMAVRRCAQRLACRNRIPSLMGYGILMLTCTQPNSRQTVEPVKASALALPSPCYAILRLVLLRCPSAYRDSQFVYLGAV